jgi:hypothetical protein
VVRFPTSRAPKAAQAAEAPAAFLGPRWGAVDRLKRERWAEEQLKGLLVDLEAPPVDEPTRLQLQRLVYVFGPQHVILMVRTIIESQGNEGALIGPVVGAVSSVMRAHPKWADKGLAWIEAFDSIPLVEVVDTMRSLDLFKETSLAQYLAMILTNKLAKIMEPPRPAPVVPTKKERAAATKLSTNAARVAAIKRNIALGRELLELRAKTPSNKKFCRERNSRFGDMDVIYASEAMRVARVYGDRPEIYRRVPWAVLASLASPNIPEAARALIERRSLDGERVMLSDVTRARSGAKPGRAHDRGAGCGTRRQDDAWAMRPKSQTQS